MCARALFLIPLPLISIVNASHVSKHVVHVLHVQWGQSPLWFASLYGHLKCVELLIDAGAQVDVQEEVSVSSCTHLSHRASPGDQCCACCLWSVVTLDTI